MAIDLERNAKHFKDLGHGDIAQGISAWASVARARGIETFTTPALPEGVIRLPDIKIGGKSPQELEEMLDSSKIEVGTWARDMIRNKKEFTTLPDQKTLSLVKAKVSDLGLTRASTLTEILERAGTFGLEKCPVEAAVYQRLADKNQPLNAFYYMAMDPITDSHGRPRVFELARDGYGLWLGGSFALPDSQWYPEGEFVFSPRK